MYSPRLIWVCIFVHVSLRVFVHSSSANICQSQMNKHKSTCYWVDTKTDTVTGSQERCATYGGNLATIDSAETSQFLKDFLDAAGITGFLWIGYDERDQTWKDGTPFSWSNYYPGEPNFISEYYTLLEVAPSYGWHDVDSSRLEGGLCQLQISQYRQFDFVAVDQGSTVSVGDRVVVVQSDSVISCGVECVRDAYCFVYRYIQADKMCTMYNSGNIVKMVNSPGEWFQY